VGCFVAIRALGTGAIAFVSRLGNAPGIPRQWIQKIRRAMITLVPQFNTWRMVQAYTRKYYLAR